MTELVFQINKATRMFSRNLNNNGDISNNNMVDTLTILSSSDQFALERDMKEGKIVRWGRLLVTVLSVTYLALIIAVCIRIDRTESGTEYGPLAKILNHSFPALFLILFSFLALTVYILIRKLRKSNSQWSSGGSVIE